MGFSVSKSINTLVKDIYELLEKGEAKIDSDKLAKLISNRLERKEKDNRLRMSNFGTPCDRKLWYSVNKPEVAEPLSGSTKLKFLMGDILEEVVCSLAEQAGHEVIGDNNEVELNGVRGHWDRIIDGVLVDVKSANSRSIEKFKYHQLEENDPFGYIDQINLYLRGAENDARLRVKGETAFLAIDKELGHIYLDTYRRNNKDYLAEIEAKKKLFDEVNPPRRRYFLVPHNKSGNMQLDMPCRYCPFKKECWPGVRTFLYSTGPVYLVDVKRIPDVQEIK